MAYSSPIFKVPNATFKRPLKWQQLKRFVQGLSPSHFLTYHKVHIPAGDLKACSVAGHWGGTTSWEMKTFSYMRARSSTLTTWQAISCHVSWIVSLASQSSVEESEWVYEGAEEELERSNPLQRSSQPTASLFHAPCNLGETDTSFHPIPALGSGYLVFFSFVWPKQNILAEGLC